MNVCKHEFIGTVSGVHCKKCGISMTTEEYSQYLTFEKVDKPKRTSRKRVNVNE